MFHVAYTLQVGLQSPSFLTHSLLNPNLSLKVSILPFEFYQYSLLYPVAAYQVVIV